MSTGKIIMRANELIKEVKTKQKQVYKNLEIILSRINELKEVKTYQYPVYIHTDEGRDAVVFIMKEDIKSEGIFPSDNEVEDFVDLFRPIFSLNIILAIHFYELCGNELEGVDVIEKIKKSLKILDEKSINFSYYIPTAILEYRKNKSKK